MLMSMTGFGKAVTTAQDRTITVEIKSLNSKQLDAVLRIPQSLRALEVPIRSMLQSTLERGKVELFVSVEQVGGDAVMNVEALASCRNAISAASRELGIPEPQDWWPVLLRFPNVTAPANDSGEEEDTVFNAAVMSTIQSAIDQLMAHRRAEGLKLEAFFGQRLDGISALLAQTAPFETERIDRIRKRLEENLAKLSTVEIDSGRLEQEMFFYIEKLDVNEEKQRLTQHINYFRETMALPTPGQGKKLGFIAQEMGREINTLGSKSNQADMQQLVVRMKDLLEQIKEQVLNVM